MSDTAQRTRPSMRSWIDFWNGDNAVYVNERHKARNAERIGRDICRHIPRPDAVVLDFGCGEALYAEEVKRHCGRLILCDAAETIRAGLAARLANYPGIDVVTPDDLPRLPDATFDLIVVNSVIQYIGKDQLGGHLDLWRTKLKPDGRLVVADVIPPGVSPMTDALALLHFAWSGGFLWGALTGLVRTALSDYGRIRKELGFSMYSEVEFIALLARHGFAAERVHPNFCHNQARMTFSARNMSP